MSTHSGPSWSSPSDSWRVAARATDAIHLASAEAILDDGDVMVVFDTRLAEAAASIGIEALVPAETERG